MTIRKRLALISMLAVGVTACSDDDPSGPEFVDITGTYGYEFNVANTDVQFECAGSGRMTIDQNGDQVSGQSTDGDTTCTGDLTLPNDGQLDGKITGQTVEFTFPFADADCTVNGTVSGSTLSGDMQCTVFVPAIGQDMELNGTWEATRA